MLGRSFVVALLAGAIVAVAGWSTGATPGTGEVSTMEPAAVAAATPDSASALQAGAQLLASEPPEAVVAGSVGQPAWSVDRLPVMRSSALHRGEQQGHIGYAISLIAAASANVQASAFWIGAPVYWQAALMVAGAVLVFACCLGCSYCLCLAASEREAKKRIARRARMAHK